MSSHIRDVGTSFRSVPAAPLAVARPAAAHPDFPGRQLVSASNNTPPHHVRATVVPKRHSSARQPGGVEIALNAPFEGMGAIDFSRRGRRMTSDVSDLDCGSVKADPRYNPAVDEVPFVPPLEIAIPTTPALLSWQQQHLNANRKRDHRSKNDRVSFPPDGNNPDLTPASPFTRSKSFHGSRTMKTKRGEAVRDLPPPYAHSRRSSNPYSPTRQVTMTSNLDASLEDYANGAGAVSWDDQSLFSYFTSPTDLYTSDDSDPIPLHHHAAAPPAKKSVVKRELKKIAGRFRHSKSKKAGKQLQPQHAVEEQSDDYASFGSSRGFC